MEQTTVQPAAPKQQLTLFDSTCIIVGVIIGSGIYETSPKIAAAASGIAAQWTEQWPWLGEQVAQHVWLGWLVSDAALIIGVWLLGGLLSLIGALCYAELANAYPKSGGDYVYLTRAFGREMGFLFAWAQLWVVRPASIGMYAYVFARYANQLYALPEHWNPFLVYAAGAIVLLSLINMLGVMMGKWTQNVLTVIKVLGLAAIVAVGLWATPSEVQPAQPMAPWGNLGLAMILVLYTYGGWNEMAYVAAEVRNPRKNILRALILGTVAVASIYALVNVAFIRALGVVGFRSSQAVATDVLNLVTPWAGKIISILICISTLGAINGMIFTGARIYYAMGTDHKLYSWLGSWDQKRGAPVASLVAQGLVTLAMVVGFGWQAGEQGFDALLAFSAPIFWFFFLLVGLGLFALRTAEPDRSVNYRVPGYPIIPVLFCLSSLFMLYSSINYAVSTLSTLALWAIGIMLLGLVLTRVGQPAQTNKQA